MLARLAALLLVLNLGWLAWSQGWLQPLGLGPVVQTEPERLQRQLHPEALRIGPLSAPPPATPAEPTVPAEVAAPAESAASAASEPATPAPDPTPEPAPAAEPEAPEAEAAAAAPAPGATEAVAAVADTEVATDTDTDTATEADPDTETDVRCLQAGLFDAGQVATLRRAAATALPEGRWQIDEVWLTGRWMVYLGGLPNAAAVAARRTELRAQGIDTDRPGAALEPGLSLGRYSTEAAAGRALADLVRQGVDGARVVQERRDRPAHRLHLPRVDAALALQLDALRPALAGKALQACD